MMVTVLIYAYATGTFSSRAVARKLEEDVAFRMLAAGNFPQHRTVCEFRRRHLAAEFSELFVGVVQVAREMGLARFGKLSVDGTKVRAITSTVPMAAMSGPAHGRGVLLHHLGQGLDPGQKTKPIHAEMDCVHRVRQRRHRNRGGKGFRAAGTTDIISHGVVLPFGFAAPGA